MLDDDAGDALLVEELLAEGGSGLSVVWTSSVADAARAVSSRTACILLDLGFPDSAGLDTLRRVLMIAGRVPVIVLTGRADRDLGETALAQGAQDYLVKGIVGGEELTRAIRFAVERRRGDETARRLAEAEHQAAEKARLERGLLPRPVIVNPRLKWATRYRPGGGRALLGGDFFDAIELEDGTVRVVVGDVTGHGPNEAALGVALRVAWRALVLGAMPADSVLQGMQRLLTLERHAEDVFATVCDISLTADLRRATARIAGHPCPLMIGVDSVEQISVPTRGPLLGLTDDTTWRGSDVELGDDWGLVVFTDGVVEGRSPSGGRLDVTGLARIATKAVSAGAGLGSLADELIAGAEEANGGALPDDVALFLLGAGPRW